jgi:hypothetical protein
MVVLVCWAYATVATNFVFMADWAAEGFALLIAGYAEIMVRFPEYSLTKMILPKGYQNPLLMSWSASPSY